MSEYRASFKSLGLSCYGVTAAEARERLGQMLRLLWDTVEAHGGDPAMDLVRRAERLGDVAVEDADAAQSAEGGAK